MKQVILFCITTFLLFGCRFATQTPKTDFIVCVTFDDNCASVYEYALPVMTQYGFRGTVFTNSGFVGYPDKLTWTQIDSLKHIYNWEIGGHTLYHETLAELTYEEAEYTISTDFNILKARGLNPKSFATTYGYCPVDYYSLINKYYKNIRTCFNTSMHCPIDRTLLGCFDVSKKMSAQNVIDRINQGIVEQENLIILLFHDIDPENLTYMSNCDPQVFAEIMWRLHRLGIKVLPLDEAVEYLSD